MLKRQVTSLFAALPSGGSTARVSSTPVPLQNSGCDTGDVEATAANLSPLLNLCVHMSARFADGVCDVAFVEAICCDFWTYLFCK